jgi:hypothetical protein
MEATPHSNEMGLLAGFERSVESAASRVAGKVVKFGLSWGITRLRGGFVDVHPNPG